MLSVCVLSATSVFFLCVWVQIHPPPRNFVGYHSCIYRLPPPFLCSAPTVESTGGATGYAAKLDTLCQHVNNHIPHHNPNYTRDYHRINGLPGGSSASCTSVANEHTSVTGVFRDEHVPCGATRLNEENKTRGGVHARRVDFLI